MTTLVTGATGHIGNNLIRLLLKQGHDVRAVYLGDDGALSGCDVQHMPGDITDADFVDEAVQGCELVFHLAAVISVDGDRHGRVRQVNVEGTRHVAAACLDHRVSRLLHCCSVHAFMQSPLDEPIDEDRARVPVDDPNYPAYDRSKAEGEAMVREHVARGLNAVIVHPSGVIGPNDFQPSRMGQMFRDLADRRLPAVLDGGFDWVDVRDVAHSMVAGIEQGRVGESYLLSGHWMSTLDLAQRAGEILRISTPKIALPHWFARGLIPFTTAYGRITNTEPRLTEKSCRP